MATVNKTVKTIQSTACMPKHLSGPEMIAFLEERLAKKEREEKEKEERKQQREERKIEREKQNRRKSVLNTRGKNT